MAYWAKYEMRQHFSLCDQQEKLAGARAWEGVPRGHMRYPCTYSATEGFVNRCLGTKGTAPSYNKYGSECKDCSRAFEDIANVAVCRITNIVP